MVVNGSGGAGGKNLPAEQRLSNLTPKPRQAFLLVALEGFSEQDAAEVLECDIATLRKLVDESGRELAAEIATDVMIIEDEPFIAMDLEGLVETLGHNVLGVARTHTEAVTLAKAKRPGLILADIQLADGSSGLDAVNELLRSFEVPVIFITAYPERFLTGERPEPAFLIAEAVPAGDRIGRGQPGAVLRAQGAPQRTPRSRLIEHKTKKAPQRCGALFYCANGSGFAALAVLRFAEALKPSNTASMIIAMRSFFGIALASVCARCVMLSRP